MTENKRYMEWDFTNPEHEAYFLDCFNGEEAMRREYPVLYGMLQDTKKLAKEDGEMLRALKAGGAAGYVDRAHIHELVWKKEARNDSVMGNSLYSKGCMSLASVKPVVHITLEIYKDGSRIARNFRTQTGVQYLELDCLAENVAEITEEDSVYALISCFWNEPDSNILRGGSVQEKLQLEEGKYVESVTCENPRKKITQKPKTILVSYGRGAASDVDYSYPEGMRDKQGNQKVTLDVNGSVKLSGAVFQRYKAHDMSMFSVSKGVILYSGAAPKCESTQDGFSWKYDMDWKDSIQSSVRYGNHQYEFDMRLHFIVKDKDGKEQEQYIDVSSLNSEDSNNAAVIPPLTLYWGCLGKDTPVRMADGTVKKISEIAVGERVAAPKGSVTVSNVWKGSEEEIYHIKTDSGKEIWATGEHQFQTDTGYVRVLELTSDSRLMTDGGKTMRPVYCYAEEYHDTVYSLDLEEGESFFAAGFVSGTMERQNTVCDRQLLPAVREELREEFEKLDRQIGNGEIFQADRRMRNDEYYVYMTVKDGKVVLKWRASYMAGDDWIGLYRDASDANDQYIGGAWQWAVKGYKYETGVDVTPGLQARYIRGRRNFACLAKTDPFPAVNEAVRVKYLGTEKQGEENAPADETLYDKTPEEAAAVLRERESLPAADAGISGICTLGYKKGKFVIDWHMDSYEYYDWIGLYENSSARQNDYITYQWVGKKAPYETGAAVKAGAQIRYIRWEKSSKCYVEVARTDGFKDLTMQSVMAGYPYWPDSSHFSKLQGAFPYLEKAHTMITADQNGQYNCIAWSLGFNDRWINPKAHLATFREFYILAGCQERGRHDADAAVAAWAYGNRPTHGSRRYQGDSGLWESKLGQSYRITHGEDELEGNTYGTIVNYFTAPKKFMAKQDRTVLTSQHYEKLGALVDAADSGLKEPFERLFAKLKEGWHSEEFRYESDTGSIRRLPVYTELMEMGAEILPLLVAKLAEEENFFALPLYDELQSERELRISYQDERYKEDVLEGEQERARRSVAAYLGRK